jgi:coniferyl-aldehyde dehydrogenase
MDIPPEFEECLARQCAACRADPVPALARRVEDLKALARMLKQNQGALIEAINLDYGVRSSFETRFLEIFPVLEGIRDTLSQLSKWMKPQHRGADQLLFPGARNHVIAQPLGVVGVIVPWNFPLNLAFGPLTDIFAAGNRAMVKMSENSSHLARLLAAISGRYFPADKLTFFEDGGGRGPAFSSLPFDHLLFTGSGATGRAVMANAARNLTPVTLELGGKAPAIVAPDFPIRTAAERIIWAKLINAGQVCVNVDYLFLPEGTAAEFVAHARRLVAERYPDLNGPDYTAVIDERSYRRLQEVLEDARAKGATLVNLAPDQVPDAKRRKLPPHIVLNVSDDMAIMQGEIFGPLLPIKTYRTTQEVVAYVNRGERPLALYPFTRDRRLAQHYVTQIMSGSVAVNEAIVQVGQHRLPFGGVGASGMGHYHGHEGFLTFSKMRPVFHQGPFSAIQAAFTPPYGVRAEWLLSWLFRLKG